MQMAIVVNLKHKRRPSGLIIIDRSTRWGNPYRIGADGSRDEVVKKYRLWLWNQIRAQRISLSDLARLHGQTLGCHCAPLACHGHVLARAAAWASGMDSASRD